MYEKKTGKKFKALETAIVKNCTVLTSVDHAVEIATNLPDKKCLIVQFTDKFQVQYLIPSIGEYYISVEEIHSNSKCLILYPECEAVTLSFKSVD